jgi:hypothetical protein
MNNPTKQQEGIGIPNHIVELLKVLQESNLAVKFDGQTYKRIGNAHHIWFEWDGYPYTLTITPHASKRRSQ